MGTFNTTDEEIKIYLPYKDVEICSRSTHLPTKKLIKIYEKKVHIAGTLELDERTGKLSNIGFNHPLALSLVEDFYKFKKTDPSYGNIGNGDEYEYEGTKNIKVEDFFNYLKVENREQIINNLI